MPYRPDGFVLPKVNGQKDITRLDYYLQALEATHNIEQNSTLVVGIATENAASVLSLNTFNDQRSEEHTSELQSRGHLVCRLLLEKKKEVPIVGTTSQHEINGRFGSGNVWM